MTFALSAAKGNSGIGCGPDINQEQVSHAQVVFQSAKKFSETSDCETAAADVDVHSTALLCMRDNETK